MSVSRRRRYWIAIVLVTLVLLGVGAFRLYFVSTNEALRHAEAFFFRRMTVAQLEQQGQYRFFYATNRKAQDQQQSVNDRFSNARAQELTFGAFDAQIESSLGLGMLINPTEWLQNREIQLLDVHTVAQPRFVEGLRDAVSRSRHGALLVVLHGYREAYESALRKTAFLGHVLDIDAPVLLFDWPGNQGGSLRGYRRAHRVADESGEELAQLLKLVVDEVQPQQIWILANSMGAQVVVKGLGTLHQHASMADAETEISHVILTAPDVDSAKFDSQFREEISALTDHLTVYVSSNDRALLASRLLNRGRRLGESTLSADQFDEAARVLELTESEDDLVSLVDVTPVNRTRNFHNFSLETPEFFDDLFLRLTNHEVPNSRPIYRVQTADGGEYYVLTRGR
ncbi:MAG: alpha/beta hydrolase [Halioglobus sp.]